MIALRTCAVDTRCLFRFPQLSLSLSNSTVDTFLLFARNPNFSHESLCAVSEDVIELARLSHVIEFFAVLSVGDARVNIDSASG